MSNLRIAPSSITDARKFVGQHHRHNLPPQGGLFACRLEEDGETRGVAIIGRPVARKLDNGYTAEITRCCTDGVSNGCSMLYGAAVRACRALGFHSVITYTLQSETGASLKASNWKLEEEVAGQAFWKNRYQSDLFGNERRPPEPKIRWRITL
jgi:hypothetical protein